MTLRKTKWLLLTTSLAVFVVGCGNGDGKADDGGDKAQPPITTPAATPQTPEASAHILSDAELTNLGMSLPPDQATGDKLPPQPGKTVLGKVVKGSATTDTNWTAFTLVLHVDGKSFRVMTQKRDIKPKGVIETAGGHLLGGQTWRDGARDELKQEAGLDVKTSELTFMQGATPKLGGRGNLYGNANFFAVYSSEPTTTNTSGEVNTTYGHQWLDVKKVYNDVKAEQAAKGNSHGKYYSFFRGHLISFCTAVIDCNKLP